jgi:hypothetical protein
MRPVPKAIENELAELAAMRVAHDEPADYHHGQHDGHGSRTANKPLAVIPKTVPLAGQRELPF